MTASLRSGTLVAGSTTASATDRTETGFQLQETLTVARGAHTLVGGFSSNSLTQTA